MNSHIGFPFPRCAFWESPVGKVRGPGSANWVPAAGPRLLPPPLHRPLTRCVSSFVFSSSLLSSSATKIKLVMGLCLY